MKSLESTEIARCRQTTTFRALSAEFHLSKYICHAAPPQRLRHSSFAVCRKYGSPLASLAESLLNFLSRCCVSASLPTAHGLHSTHQHPLGITIRGVAQSGSAPGSGPGGRRFESSRPDHSSERALLAIMSKGFLYIGVTLTASTVQFQSTIFSNLAFSAKSCESASRSSCVPRSLLGSFRPACLHTPRPSDCECQSTLTQGPSDRR
jgi:hypothetical protein